LNCGRSALAQTHRQADDRLLSGRLQLCLCSGLASRLLASLLEDHTCAITNTPSSE
jgi:hypothetical protein